MTEKRYILLLIIFLLMGCGELEKIIGNEKEKSLHRKQPSYVEIRKGHPELYRFADPDCDEHNALDDLGKVQVWVRQNIRSKQKKLKVEPVLEEFDLTGYSGRGGSGPGVREILAEAKWFLGKICQATQPEANADKLCAKKQGVLQQQKTVHLCRRGGAYPRRSIENIALAMLAAISRSHRMHQRWKPFEEIHPVILLVHPLVTVEELHFTNEKTQGRVLTTFTDNAFWYHSYRDDLSYIAALPHSFERARGDKRPWNTWESPFVMSHEWGHHLFYHYSPSLVGEFHSFKPLFYEEAFSKKSNKNELQRSQVLTAINEGFADFIAFLTYQREHSRFGFFVEEIADQKFYLGRNVFSPFHNDGHFKRLDTFLLDIFFQRKVHPFRKNGSNPVRTNYADPHTLGAVLAYGFHRYLKAKSMKNRAMGKALVQWAQNMEDEALNLWKEAQENVNSTDAFLFFLVENFLQANLASSSDAQKRQQAIAKKVFPLSAYSEESLHSAFSPSSAFP